MTTHWPLTISQHNRLVLMTQLMPVWTKVMYPPWQCIPSSWLPTIMSSGKQNELNKPNKTKRKPNPTFHKTMKQMDTQNCYYVSLGPTRQPPRRTQDCAQRRQKFLIGSLLLTCTAQRWRFFFFFAFAELCFLFPWNERLRKQFLTSFVPNRLVEATPVLVCCKTPHLNE